MGFFNAPHGAPSLLLARGEAQGTGKTPMGCPIGPRDPRTQPVFHWALPGPSLFSIRAGPQGPTYW